MGKSGLTPAERDERARLAFLEAGMMLLANADAVDPDLLQRIDRIQVLRQACRAERTFSRCWDSIEVYRLALLRHVFEVPVVEFDALDRAVTERQAIGEAALRIWLEELYRMVAEDTRLELRVVLAVRARNIREHREILAECYQQRDQRIAASLRWFARDIRTIQLRGDGRDDAKMLVNMAEGFVIVNGEGVSVEDGIARFVPLALMALRMG